ncbi:hypothetical protein [Alkanindiges illinoisensis]|uniref:hypothetical protein n=1 Tax=Alkanindiges illinoisensis TaxID=197183 RepID=UPI00047B83BF|nr:hypothetical protein [Alkanindiges illinoisensis]
MRQTSALFQQQDYSRHASSAQIVWLLSKYVDDCQCEPLKGQHCGYSPVMAHYRTTQTDKTNQDDRENAAKNRKRFKRYYKMPVHFAA